MDPEVIVEKILEQIDLLNRQPLDDFTGDTLSRIAVRLAAYKAGLGRYSTMAKKATWQAEKNFAEAKARGILALKEEGVNSTDAKELKILKASDEYDALIEAQELEDKIVSLSFNVHDLIDSIKSRVINQQMEMRESATH